MTPKPTFSFTWPTMLTLYALMLKNLTKMTRNLTALLFVFLLPAVEVIFFCVAIGREPSHLPLAIGNWKWVKVFWIGMYYCNQLLYDVIRVHTEGWPQIEGWRHRAAEVATIAILIYCLQSWEKSESSWALSSDESDARKIVSYTRKASNYSIYDAKSSYKLLYKFVNFDFTIFFHST